jgi:hypothetical protein
MTLTPAPITTPVDPTTTPTDEPSETCIRRAWYGRCLEWDGLREQGEEL